MLKYKRAFMICLFSFMALLLLSLPVCATEVDPEEASTVSPVDKRIFIGDSRTENLMLTVNDQKSIWSCKTSMGYDWMVSEGVPAIEEEITFNTAVIIWMGVNDIDNLSKYIKYINKKAAAWAQKGAVTYYVSVGPVENDPYVTNKQIEKFNASMKKKLTGVTYIDLYSYLTKKGYKTVDGTHYTQPYSKRIYKYILSKLKGILTYRVADGQATVTKVKSKTLKTLIIPARIKVGSQKIPVTGIKAKVFRNLTKLTSATIGKFVVNIGKSAFLDCSRLKKIKINTKLLTESSVGTNAFKGTNAKAVVNCPSGMAEAYKEILLKKGFAETVTFS